MPRSEIVTRGNLPHWYVPGAAHFVTYRLAETLPRQVLELLAVRREQLLARPLSDGISPAEHRHEAHKLLFADYDRYLDTNCSIDWLARPEVASLIRRSLYFHDGKKYHLLSYCVMPNHVHVLLQPTEHVDEASLLRQENVCGEQSDGSSPLSAIMHSLKSYTANEANKLLHRSGQFWQHESYDHWVRNDEELERIVDYIRQSGQSRLGSAGAPVVFQLSSRPIPVYRQLSGAPWNDPMMKQDASSMAAGRARLTKQGCFVYIVPANIFPEFL
jgi:putative DNA methylase